MSAHFPPCRGSCSRFTELHGHGGLHPEDTVPGRHDPGGILAVGFYGPIGGTGSQAQGQSYSLPRRTGTEPPMGWDGHSGQTWQVT